MAVKFPQADLPRGLRGGADVWDQPQASVVLDDDWFDAGVTVVGADLAGAYQILSAGLTAVSADLTGAYGLRSLVSADRSGAYSLANLVNADRTGAYALLNGVAGDLAGAYVIAESLTQVGRDLAGAYALFGLVGADRSGAYALAEFVGGEFSGSYIIDSLFRSAPSGAGYTRGGAEGSRPAVSSINRQPRSGARRPSNVQ
jgi:hypothetical protein